MYSKRKISERAKTFIPKSIQCFREGYSFRSFFKDIFAGINVGMIAFPLAIAVAIGANMAPEHGLFTAIVAGFLISLFGGSRVQIGGPTSTLIVILYSIMLRHGFQGMLVATFMAGIILILFGFMGLGTYIKFIPYPVVMGLTTGIAVVLFSSQFKEFLGLQMGEIPIDFLGKWQSYFESAHTFNPKSLAIGLGTLMLMIYFRRFRPKLPGAIFALLVATFITWAFGIDVDTIGSRYGSLPRQLPMIHFPLIGFNDFLALVPDALTIAILTGIESLLSAVLAEGMTGWRHQSNCELVAQGLANVGASLFGGMPASGSLSRTAANVKSGATTPISGLVHAMTLFAMLYFLAPLTFQIPMAALAAVLIMMAWSMSQIHHFVHLFTAPKKDIIVLVAVFTLTVLININAAVQVGMILAAFLFMKHMSDMSDVVAAQRYLDEGGKEDSQADPDSLRRSEVPEEVEVYELNGPFFFGVADRLKNLLHELNAPPKIFILRMRRVPSIDASGMHALEEFFLTCKKQGTTLLLSGVKSGPLRDLKRYHLDELIGEDHIFTYVDAALDFSKELLRIEKFKRAMTYNGDAVSID